MDSARPLMLGIVGDSAAGKTTLIRGVVRLLGREGVTPICLDDYHRYGRAERLSRGITAADPAANDLGLMAEHLAALRAGAQISKPVYDHRRGELRGPELVAPTSLVIAYGMLTLTPPALAELFDLTVYLEPDEGLRQRWRVDRDVAERGYTSDEVQRRRPARDRDAARYIHGQRPLADLVLRFRVAHSGAADLAATIDLRPGRRGADRPLAVALGQAGLAIEELSGDDDGRPASRLHIGPGLSQDTLARLAAALRAAAPELPPIAPEQLGQVQVAGGASFSSALALAQLIVAYQLCAARR